MKTTKFSLLTTSLLVVIGSTAAAEAAPTPVPASQSAQGASNITINGAQPNYTVEFAQPVAAPAPAPAATTAPATTTATPAAAQPAPQGSLAQMTAPQAQVQAQTQAQAQPQYAAPAQVNTTATAPAPQAAPAQSAYPHPRQQPMMRAPLPQTEAPAYEISVAEPASSTTAVTTQTTTTTTTAPAATTATPTTYGQGQGQTLAPTTTTAAPAQTTAPAVATATATATAPTAPYIIEDQLNPPTPSAEEIQNQQYVTDQLYPAGNDAYARGAFSPDNAAPSADQPSFSFTNQTTTVGGATVAVGPDGQPLTPTTDPNDPDLANTQEVSVTVLGSFDDAIKEAFKSLESGITLGSSTSDFTLDQIAPSIRSLSSDADGNLVLRFSLPMAENILKQGGITSWDGLSNPVLVWMVGLDGTQSDTDLSLVSGQNLSTFAQAILQAAPDYKYRLMFPILDLEDMQQVNVNTVLDHQDQVLMQASKRYGADYFVAAAISSVPNESGVTLKWNLYNKDGIAIASSALSGLMDEVASLGAGDIARALMTFQETLTQETQTAQIRVNSADIDLLGPGVGFVRLRIGNVRSLEDIKKVRNAFVTYGFDGDVQVVGYDQGQFVIDVNTNSDATNLEGSMRHSGDFSYLAPWTFNFRGDGLMRTPVNSQIGPANPNRPNSQLSQTRNAAKPQATLL